MKSVSFGGDLESSVLPRALVCLSLSDILTLELGAWCGSSCRFPWLASPAVETSSHKMGQGLLTGVPVFLGALCPKIEPLTGQKKEVVLVLGNTCWNLASATSFGGRMGLGMFCPCWNESPPIGNWSGERTLCVWLHQCGVAFLSPRAERG